jgi:mono/diheme cytochrome c family protein
MMCRLYCAKPTTTELNGTSLNNRQRRDGVFRYVRVHCAQCHAIDKVSASPVTNAPPFRVLNLKYGVADLQRPLAEGVHPMMPLFRLSPGEIEDIMAYLKTLR